MMGRAVREPPPWVSFILAARSSRREWRSADQPCQTGSLAECDCCELTENVTRVSLTSRRTTEQKRHLTVSNGLLGQVIVDDEGVLAVVTVAGHLS